MGCAVLLACLFGILFAAASARAGELVQIDFAAAALNRDWHYTAYLPNGYADGKQNYPVLYLLHGYGKDSEEWVAEGRVVELIDRLIASGAIPPCLVVMPSAGSSWYIDRDEPMETAFIRDLIPDVDRRFRTIVRRSGRVIGGESMGGYGALRFVLKYPELFLAGALFSPAIYVPEPPQNSMARQSGVFQTDGRFDPEIWTAFNYPTLIPGFLAKHIEVQLYLGCGSQDQFSIDLHMAKLWASWIRHGWRARWQLAVGRHDFVLWRKLAPTALTFVFKNASRPEARLTPPVTQVGSTAKPPG